MLSIRLEALCHPQCVVSGERAARSRTFRRRGGAWAGVCVRIPSLASIWSASYSALVPERGLKSPVLGYLTEEREEEWSNPVADSVLALKTALCAIRTVCV